MNIAHLIEEVGPTLPTSLLGLLIFVVVTILGMLAWIVKQGFSRGIDALTALRLSVDNAGSKVLDLKGAIETDAVDRKSVVEKHDAQHRLDLQSEDMKRESAVREVLRVNTDHHLKHSTDHATLDAKVNTIATNISEIAKNMQRLADAAEIKRTTQ